MTSGSIGRWLLKLFDLPAATLLRMWGLSILFFRDACRLREELRLPWPLMQHVSGTSFGRLWLIMGWEEGRELVTAPEGGAGSANELGSPWLSLWRKALRILPDSGLFLCLSLQKKQISKLIMNIRCCDPWQPQWQGKHAIQLKKKTPQKPSAFNLDFKVDGRCGKLYWRSEEQQTGKITKIRAKPQTIQNWLDIFNVVHQWPTYIMCITLGS